MPLRLYHGCPCPDDAAAILREGLRQIPRAHATGRRALLAPLPGRVYLAQDLHTALSYARRGRRNDWAEVRTGRDHGVLFEIAADPRDPDLWPDEDDLGEAVAIALRLRWGDADAFEDPDCPTPLLADGNAWLAALVGRDPRLAEALVALATRRLDAALLDRMIVMRRQDVDGVTLAEAGKTLLDRGLPERLRRTLIDQGASVSLPGPVAPVGARRVPRDQRPSPLDELAALAPWPAARGAEALGLVI